MKALVVAAGRSGSVSLGRFLNSAATQAGTPGAIGLDTDVGAVAAAVRACLAGDDAALLTRVLDRWSHDVEISNLLGLVLKPAWTLLGRPPVVFLERPRQDWARAVGVRMDLFADNYPGYATGAWGDGCLPTAVDAQETDGAAWARLEREERCGWYHDRITAQVAGLGATVARRIEMPALNDTDTLRGIADLAGIAGAESVDPVHVNRRVPIPPGTVDPEGHRYLETIFAEFDWQALPRRFPGYPLEYFMGRLAVDEVAASPQRAAELRQCAAGIAVTLHDFANRPPQ